MAPRTVFESKPLPSPLAAIVRERLERAHAQAPFSPLDPRAAARRTTQLVADLGLEGTVYRGGLDLRGTEVDHVWLAVVTRDDDRQHASRAYPGAAGVSPAFWVLDAAFPLFAEAFVAALRRFVAGDAEPSDLADSAASSGVSERILGEFPSAVRYIGAPVWSSR